MRRIGLVGQWGSARHAHCNLISRQRTPHDSWHCAMSNTELRCTGAVAADSVGGRTQQEIAAYRSTRCRVGWGRAVGSTANRWTPPRTVEMCLRIRACVRAFRLHGPRLLPLSACPKASRILASCSDPFCAGRRDYSKHPKSKCRNLASCFLPNFFLNYYSCLLRAKNGF